MDGELGQTLWSLFYIVSLLAGPLVAWWKGKNGCSSFVWCLLTGGFALLYFLMESPERGSPALRDQEEAERRFNEMRSAEAEAKWKYERQQRDSHETSLLARGDLIKISESEMVVCSNGHRYKKRDFVIETPEVYTNEYHHVLTDYHHSFGCPLCKSTSWSFANTALNNYRKCKQGHWYKRQLGSCPQCSYVVPPISARALAQPVSYGSLSGSKSDKERLAELKGSLEKGYISDLSRIAEIKEEIAELQSRL